MLTLIIALAGCGGTEERHVTIPPPIGPGGTMKPVFTDEFNERSLDVAKWANCYPYGEPTCTNSGNKELELYTPDGIAVRDGHLQLTASKPAAKVVDEKGTKFAYTSGMVTTGPDPTAPDSAPKFRFQYGYVEARVKVPAGKGLWPAVWLLPTEDPWPPEIDVLEVLGHDPSTAHVALHWEKPKNKKEDDAKLYTARGVDDLSAGFHTFGVNWQEDAITWYRDGVEIARYSDVAHVPHEPMYLLMNLAVGGGFPGSPSKSTKFPATFEVDWVRIWQQS